MTVFYLPIEHSTRELTAKVFLANRLAQEGHIPIIFRSDILDTTGWPSAGVYIGKNCFRTEWPYSLKYYKKMKSSGVDLWHLDEEGGILYGRDEEEWKKRIATRLDPTSLDSNDKILTWGEWQAESFSSKKPTAEIRIVGSPLFDLFQKKYAIHLSEFDDRQTEGLKDFILLNSNFSHSNGTMTVDMLLGENRSSSKIDDRLKIAKRFVADGQLLYSFIKLIQELSEKLPDEQLVLRPHPAENIELYKKLLIDCKNVNIVKRGEAASWIRRCKCLISNGSSTALQAKIFGKKVFAFVPFKRNDDRTMALPNDLGVKFSSVDELLNKINDPQADDLKVWSRTISKLDSIEEIVSLASESSINYASKEEIVFRNLNKSLRKFFFKEALKNFIRPLFTEKRNNYLMYMEHFDPEFFSLANDLNNSACSFWDSQIKLKPIGRNCYVFSS